MEATDVDRAQDQAAARADGRHRQRLLQHQVASGTRTTRRCCRSATAASRRRSKRPSATAATGAPRSPRPASTPTSTSSAIGRTTRVLPWDIIDGGMKASFFRVGVRQGPPRRMDAAAQATERERAAPAGADLGVIRFTFRVPSSHRPRPMSPPGWHAAIDIDRVRAAPCEQTRDRGAAIGRQARLGWARVTSPSPAHQVPGRASGRRAAAGAGIWRVSWRSRPAPRTPRTRAGWRRARGPGWRCRPSA